jgi:hypothetical protein
MYFENFDTPILLLTFNRPVLLAGLIDKLRSVRPRKIYFASDGPRLVSSTDKLNVDECRALMSSVDWDCQIFRKLNDTNLGCRNGIVSAVNWFFENEEAGIILEDDCWPEPTFFSYCENLLEVHKRDSNVMSITGYNALGVDQSADQNYYFSHFGGIWGWATWRRAWARYDNDNENMRSFAESDYLLKLLGDSLGAKRKAFLLEGCKLLQENKIDTWDLNWAYTRHRYSGLTCVPKYNLIRNVGFGNFATNTTSRKETVKSYGNIEMDAHSELPIIPNREYDEYFISQISTPSLIKRILNKIKHQKIHR